MVAHKAFERYTKRQKEERLDIPTNPILDADEAKVAEYVSVARIGTSLGFRISRSILNIIGAKIGDKFELKVNGNNLIFERKKS